MGSHGLERRDVLVGVGAALAAGLAGCTESLSLDSGGNGGDDGGSAEYATWLGPNVLDVQDLEGGSTDGAVEGVVAYEPVAVSETPLEGEIPTGSPGAVGLSTEAWDLDAENVDLGIADEYQTFVVLTGTFDAEAHEATLSEIAEREATHEDRPIFVNDFQPPGSDARAWEGIAVGEETIVVSRLAADADAAATDVERILDVGSGSSERYIETSDTFSNTVDQVGAGAYVSYSRVHPDYPWGTSISVSGDRATITTASVPLDGSVDENVDSIRERIDSAPHPDDIGRGDEFSTYWKYDEARVEDDVLVMEGNRSRSDLSLIDYNSI